MNKISLQNWLRTFGDRCLEELPWIQIAIAAVALCLLLQHRYHSGWVQGPSFLYLSGFILYYTIRQMLPDRAGSVQTLWYFFSLALVATVLIGLAAHFGKLIDGHGEATGKVGKFILWLSSSALDVQADFYLALGIAVLIVAPQLLSYVLSGLFGCASTPVWLGSSVPVIFYGMAKSCIVAAGVLMPLAFFEYSWKQIPSIELALNVQYVGVALIVAAFLFLWYLEQVEYIADLILRKLAGSDPVWLHRMHEWMTRNRKKSMIRSFASRARKLVRAIRLRVATSSGSLSRWFRRVTR